MTGSAEGSAVPVCAFAKSFREPEMAEVCDENETGCGFAV